MGTWQKVGENLVKHWAGGIYLRAKLNGKQKRISLETKDLRIAKLKRDALLTKMRKAATVQASANAQAEPRTLNEALALLEGKVTGQANLEPPTVKYYGEIFGIIRDTMNCDAPIRALTAPGAMTWWRSVAKKYSAQRANNVLGMAKRLGKMMIEAGLRVDDPWAELHRVKIPEKKIEAMSVDQLDAVVADIRAQGKAHSQESANFVAFMAYSGCRLGQVQALRWGDIDDEWVEFRSGVSGTKGTATRQLPISTRLRAVLDGMKRGKPGERVFAIKNPHEALTRACVRLKVPHLRIHDLRHFFASWSLESGVDVRVAAQWLGHKDNGVLLLRRYAHVRNEHSKAMAEKLK